MATGHFPLPDFFNIPGIRLSTVSAGIKAVKDDVTLIEINEGAQVAAVFTTNAFCAAPVVIAKSALQETVPTYLLINTGNANAGNGEAGLLSATACVEAVAEKTGCKVSAVLPFSTGVIGEPLPHGKIIGVLDQAINGLSEEQWPEAANAILTTDTRAKGVSKTMTLAGKSVYLSGICKGSGMIKPNMATMLAFIATDLAIDDENLKRILREVNGKSFNRISVDSDTSTNDAVVLIATGESGIHYRDLDEGDRVSVENWLQSAFVELAQLIIRDGEGATKFVEITVVNGLSEHECETLGFVIAHSPLVKTALFASDPNWGRLLMAIGKADIDALDINTVDIRINGNLLVRHGTKVDSFTEAVGCDVFSQEDIVVEINLNRGYSQATIWSTDLSYDYIKINAEYRT